MAGGLKRILLLALLGGILLALIGLPLPIPSDTDFVVLYRAGLGLRQGLSPYDVEGQTRMIAAFEGVPPESLKVIPYPYPPWYALVGLPLAFLSPSMAARIWFLLNCAMLMGAVWFLTDGWPARRRLPAFLVAALFLPVLGGLLVGQFGFPTLLGAAMLGYALGREKAGLTALSLAFLTFKPHVGILILLVGLTYLLFRRDDFGRRALRLTLLIGVSLFILGLVASRAWPVEYLLSLVGFRGVSMCRQCTSLSMEIATLFQGNFDGATAISIFLLALAVGVLVWHRRTLAEQPRLLVAAAALATLLASPYLQNYDYLLLLVPLLTIAGQARGLDWLWLALAYLLPLPGLLITGFDGEFTLIISTLILAALFVRMVRQPVSLLVPA